MNRTISSAHIASHCKIVREKSILRKMISGSSDIIEKAYSEDFTDLDQFLDQSEERFYRLGETKKSEGLVNPMEVVKTSLIKIEDLYKRKADITGVATGFTHLDRMSSGLHPGELTIVAARPSMGKTAFSLNIAQQVALGQKNCRLFLSRDVQRGRYDEAFGLKAQNQYERHSIGSSE